MRPTSLWPAPWDGRKKSQFVCLWGLRARKSCDSSSTRVSYWPVLGPPQASFLASWIVKLAARLNPEIARLSGSIFDVRVLFYTLALALLTTIVCGILPSFSFSRMDLNHSLKNNAAGAIPRTQTLRKVLIVAE